MAVYLMTGQEVELLPETSFEAEGIGERTDLQRLLRDHPNVLEEGLFIVAEEFRDWVDANRRIDLLGVDGNNRLVVVELKRSDADSLMDLQAIRYAAMVSNMTLAQVIDAHQRYLQGRGIEGDADTRVNEHLSAGDAELHTDNPRIILASANFSRELTTSVLWLNQRGLDITCIKLQPCKTGEALLLERNQVIPMPEATDYLVRLRDRAKEAEQQDAGPVETVSGGDLFREAIETSHVREFLGRLHQWAASLESDNLAWLETRRGSYNTVLRVNLPNNRRLVNIYKNRAGSGYLEFQRGPLGDHAPRSLSRVEQVIQSPISSGQTLWEIPDGLLEVLTDAYREANGRPTVSVSASLPPSDIPGDPPPAE